MFQQQENLGLPTRVHSPVSGMPRRVHPGAVLLSPQSTAMNNIHSTGASGEKGNGSHMPLSPQLSSQHLSLNDLLDQQQNMLMDHTQRSAAGPAVVSPLLQPNTSMFLDSFTRPTSSMGALPAPAPTNMVNFTHDVNQLCSWMLMLSSAQQNSVMDNLLSSLNEEVLQHTKLKLDSLISSGYISPSVRSPQVIAPMPDRGLTPQPLTLDSLLNNNLDHSMNRQWSPIPQTNTNGQPIYDYINDLTHRPRSADPQLRKKFGTPGKQIPKKSSSQPKTAPHNGMSSPTGSTGSSSSSSMNPKTLTDPKLLNNIPAWLKSLRLHKYSDALNGKSWVDLIYLNDDSLAALGVSALGARRKLLKAFSVVRDHKERGLIDSNAF
ncbi:LAFA_0C09978g1_1 [Lachancea sp. 'fantastica']|nr:LAFA_0C09978g1_1 [Lachancea sp. 'fantastica']